MKTTFKLLLVSIILFSASSAYSQHKIELDGVDSVDAQFIIKQIDEIIGDENKLDEVLLSFEDLFNLIPDNLSESLKEDEKVEAKTEYKELRTLAKKAFSELRKYSDGKHRVVYIYGDTLDDGSTNTFEVEYKYSLWRNEDEDEGAEVDFIYLKADGKIYFIYAEAY
jgi:hypothetical protein